MSLNRASSTTPLSRNASLLTEYNLARQNRRMDQQGVTSPFDIMNDNDTSSDSSSDRSITPPPEFTYNRRPLTSVAPRRSPSPARTNSFSSLTVASTTSQRRRNGFTRPALILEGMCPQRPASATSSSSNHNREPTPSLRNTLTQIDEPSPQTPPKSRKEEHSDQKNREKATSETSGIRDLLPEKTMHHTPTKRPISEDQYPKKIQRSADVPQSNEGLPIITVNDTKYYQCKVTQVGGSGAVYKIISKDKFETLALKLVKISTLSESNFEACMNEVRLLQELQGNDCVVKLLNYELAKEEGVLKLVFEFGETDIDQYMRFNKLDIRDTRHFWRKMVEAVSLLHERRVVHSDLKPANFMIVCGRVKIIDFGIAKTINQGTQNIHRDTISGTSNYLAPEAVRDVGLTDEFLSDENNDQGISYPLYKVGKPADIWALGIILYRMVYGTTPFSSIKSLEAKAIAIVRKKVEYPLRTIHNEEVTIELLNAMKWCLRKDASKRPTADQLLHHPFLSP